MGVLAPVNEEFLKSKRDDFTKATDPSSILCNGPYLLKSLVTKSSVEFAKTPNYWDKDNVHIDKIKLSFWDGQDTSKPAENFKDVALQQPDFILQMQVLQNLKKR